MASKEEAPEKIEPKFDASGVEASFSRAAVDAPGSRPGVASNASLDTLVSVVLDSAGVANRSASIAASSTESLLTAVGDLGKVVARARMTSIFVLGVAALSIVAAAGALFSITVQLSSRLTQTNATLLAVGKRAVEMNTGIEYLKHIETTLAEIASKQGSDQFQKLEAKIDATLTEIRKPVAVTQAEKPPVEKPAKQNDERYQALLTQIKALDAQAQAQTRSIARMSELIAASKAELSKTMGIARNVEIQLANFNERQRPPAQVPAPSAPAPREREKPPEQKSKDYIQYSAPQPDKSDKPR